MCYPQLMTSVAQIGQDNLSDDAATYAGRRIPSRIFQTWKSKTEFPGGFAYWMRTFRELNPSFAHLLWDDDDNRDFIAGGFDWFLRTYDGYPREIYRADAVRYFFLYCYGGIYADMDVECLKPLDRLLELGDIVLVRMGPDPDFPGSVPNAIMASRPRQEFWLFLISRLLQAAASPRSPEETTGPVLLKSALDLYLTRDLEWSGAAIRSVAERLPSGLQPMGGRPRFRLLPSREWFPLDWSDPIHQRVRREVLEGRLLTDEVKRELFPHASMVSYWSHMW